MDYYDVKRLALVLAVQAEIEGMKAENARRAASYEGKCSSLYSDEHFQLKANELKNLAHVHDEKL